MSLDQNHLSSLICIIRNTPPDMIIISEDGAEMWTWKFLLCLFSRTVSELLQNDNHKNDLTAISLPVKRKIIETMINMLENSKDFEQVKDNEAAVLLGITDPHVNGETDTTNILSIFMEEHEDGQNVDGSIGTVSAVEEFPAKTDEKLA